MAGGAFGCGSAAVGAGMYTTPRGSERRPGREGDPQQPQGRPQGGSWQPASSLSSRRSASSLLDAAVNALQGLNSDDAVAADDLQAGRAGRGAGAQASHWQGQPGRGKEAQQAAARPRHPSAASCRLRAQTAGSATGRLASPGWLHRQAPQAGRLHRLCKAGWQAGAHHHAQVCLELLVHGVVQHNVHELVEAAQHARHVAVGVQLDCGGRGSARPVRVWGE